MIVVRFENRDQSHHLLLDLRPNQAQAIAYPLIPDDTAPSSVRGRVLNRLRTAYPESRSKTDLLADAVIAGSAAAIKKSLQRLEAQQLIVSFVPEGSRSKEYKANLACGEVQNVSPFGTYASAGADSEGGQDEGDMTSISSYNAFVTVFMILPGSAPSTYLPSLLLTSGDS